MREISRYHDDPVGRIHFGMEDIDVEGSERFSKELMCSSVQGFSEGHVEGSAKAINIGAVAGE